MKKKTLAKTIEGIEQNETFEEQSINNVIKEDSSDDGLEKGKDLPTHTQKRKRTPAQEEAFKKAQEKLRQKHEIAREKKEMEQLKFNEIKQAKLLKKEEKLKRKQEEELAALDTSSDEEVIIKKKIVAQKPKPKKKKVVYVDSDSDDDELVVTRNKPPLKIVINNETKQKDMVQSIAPKTFPKCSFV